MDYVRMYRLAYSTSLGETGTLIAIAPPNEVWPSIVSAAGWDNAARIVRQESDGTLLAITPISDGVSLNPTMKHRLAYHRPFVGQPFEEASMDDPADLKHHDPEWRAGYFAGLQDEPLPEDASPLWRDGYEQGQNET